MRALATQVVEVRAASAVPGLEIVDAGLQLRLDSGPVPVRYCVDQLAELARGGVAFDPTQPHHRAMIDKQLRFHGLPELTGAEWSAIRHHYRALKRSRK